VKKFRIQPHKCLFVLFATTLLVSGSARADTIPAPSSDNESSSAVHKDIAKSLSVDEKAQVQGRLVGELYATEQRSLYQRVYNDLDLLFGDKLPTPVACYQAATSNYIEDKWNAFAVSSGCDSAEALCMDNKIREDQATKEFQLLEKKDAGGNSALHKKQAILLYNVWPVAGYMLKTARQLSSLLNPDGQAFSFYKPVQSKFKLPNNASDTNDTTNLSNEEKKNILDEFNKYITSCHERKPAQWATVGTAITDNQAAADEVKLGAQNLLMVSVVTSQLPTNDRGYVGCLDRLRTVLPLDKKCSDRSCADAVPVDAKQDLMSELADLKMHQCDITYTREKSEKDRLLLNQKPNQ
jgi:hypothetical protein